MSDLDPELLALGKTLKQVFELHLNGGRQGHTYGYAIVNAAGRRVGTKSAWSKGKERRVVYTIGDQEHETIEGFLLAYRQQLRDEEFDAADPKKRDSK